MTTSRYSIILAILIIIAPFRQLMGQKILLQETPAVITETPRWGTNRRHFLGTEIAFGQYFSFNKADASAGAFCNSATMGLQYKLKLSPVVSIVSLGSYSIDLFTLKRGLPSPIDEQQYKSERFRFHNLQGTLLLRLNPDSKRGNIIGKYVDAGIFSSYCIHSKRITTQAINDDEKLFTKQKITQNQLTNLSGLQYGWIIRAGNNRYSLYYRKRLTNWFAGTWTSIILPDQQLGLTYLIQR